MDQPDQEAELHFSHPVRQITLMLIVLGLTAFAGYFALPQVLPVFIANPYLNGFIAFVFLIGVLACFGQMLSLISSVRWIEGFVSHAAAYEEAQPPQLLAPLASLLRSRGARSQISATSTRSILDSVATRIDEGREITRYLVNLLIFLGLLGTFYGLATSVPAIVETIGNLTPKAGESGSDVFARLQKGLESQMGGMGIAFASSLLGLAGSLVVGLLELFAGHGQNRFYRELEEWLSSITRLGFSSAEGESSVEHSVISGVLDHVAEQMESLQMMFTQSDVSRALVDDKLSQLVDGIGRMTDRMETQAPTTQVLLRVAEGQERLITTLEQQETGEGIDAESRMRLRSIDVQMLRILEEISAGRQESMAQVRTDMATLTRTIQDQQPTAKPIGKVRRRQQSQPQPQSQSKPTGAGEGQEG